MARLNLKKKSLSSQIIENSKNNDIISINSLINDLSDNESKIKELSKRKQELLNEIKNELKKTEQLFENYRIFCYYSRIISIIGPPRNR